VEVSIPPQNFADEYLAFDLEEVSEAQIDEIPNQ